jgi:hypothetical protein
MSEARPTQAGSVTPVAPVLSDQQLRELDDARLRWRKVQRAVAFARFSAWSMAVFAIGGLLIGLFDVTSAVVGLLLLGITVIEFRGAALLKKASPKGPMVLGWNQLMLLGMVGAYCFYQAYIATPQPMVSDPQVQEMLADPATRQALQDAGLSSGLLQMIENPGETNKLLYALVAFASVLVQGLTSLYYFSRRRVVDAYLRATPAWVLEVQRRAA